EAGVGRSEAAGVEVEAAELGTEVDVQPLAPGGPGVPSRDRDQLGSDAAALMLAAGLRVEQEGVIATVPRHVHEPDQLIAHAGRDPAETVLADLVPPPGDRVAPVRLDQVRHL